MEPSLPPAATLPPMTEAIARRLDAGSAAWNRAGMRGVQTLDGDGSGVDFAEFGLVTAFRSRAQPGIEYYNRAYLLGSEVEQHLGDVTAFFRDEGITGRIEVSPLSATLDVTRLLHEHGYRFERTYPVFYGQPLDAAPPDLPPAIEIRPSPDSEIDRWLAVWFEGFSIPNAVWDAVSRIRTAWFTIPGYERYTATIDGEIVAIAGLFVRGDIAMLEPGAVLPGAQGSRLHTALVRRRIAGAHAAGCTLVFVETAFATTSHRNQQRQGLGLAFNRLVFVDGTAP